MKRKVIKQGNNTLTITLPRKWCESFNVTGGDEISVEEADNQLLISKNTALQSREVDIDVTDFDKTMVGYCIRYLYRNGFDIRTVRYKNETTIHYRFKKESPVFNIISDEINNLIGMEILERRDNSVVIKCMVDDSPDDFDNFLRRIFLLTSMMFEHMITSFEHKDTTGLSLIREDHDTITKFISYCLRVLNKNGHTNYYKNKQNKSLLEHIERIIDVMEEIALEGINYKDKIKQGSIAILDGIKRIFDDYINLFYKFDNKKIIMTGKARGALFELIEKSRKDMNREELWIISKLEVIPGILIRELIGIRFGLEY